MHPSAIMHSDLSLQAQALIRQADADIHSLFDMGTVDLYYPPTTFSSEIVVVYFASPSLKRKSG